MVVHEKESARLGENTRGDNLFGTIQVRGRPVLCSRGSRRGPQYIVLEVYYDGRYPNSLVIVWKPFSNKRRTVLIVPNYAETWDASILAIFYLLSIDTIIISDEFDIRSFWLS